MARSSVWNGVNPWPALWADNDNLLAEARRESYLVHVAASGELACKACGRYLPWEDPHAHFKAHMQELDRYIESKRQGHREARLVNLAKARAARYTPQEEAILHELGVVDDDE